MQKMYRPPQFSGPLYCCFSNDAIFELYGLNTDGYLSSRAAQYFWGLNPQTPNWKLAQTVKVYLVSSSSEIVIPHPQSPKDKHQRPSLEAGQMSSGLCGRVKMTSDGLETWYTFTFWANFQFGVWGMS